MINHHGLSGDHLDGLLRPLQAASVGSQWWRVSVNWRWLYRAFHLLFHLI